MSLTISSGRAAGRARRRAAGAFRRRRPNIWNREWLFRAAGRHLLRTAKRLASVCTLLAVGAPSSATAAALQVAPVSLDLPTGARAAQLTLQNLGDTPINAQLRVFRWEQKDGADQVTPATDVVASPPAASLVPGQSYFVRIVRTSPKPPEGEESYRLLVDELPQPSNDARTRINFVVRYSIPIFFGRPNGNPQLVWSAVVANEQVSVTVRNLGARHARISRLRVEDPSGITASFGEGLVGYVLPGSTMTWTVPVKGMVPLSLLKITARGDDGDVSATAMLASAVE